jgi:sugar phosphate isomerase/epimerase
MRAPLLRVWAESFAEDPRDMSPTVELMQAACDAAAPVGITVVIERHRGSFADSPERVEELFRRIDRANAALNYQVLDFLDPAQIDAQAADAARLIPFARYFHLKNYRHGAQPNDPLQLGGSLAGGVLDYTAILGAALDAGYDGPMTIEFLSGEPGTTEEKLAADVEFVRRTIAAVSK